MTAGTMLAIAVGTYALRSIGMWALADRAISRTLEQTLTLVPVGLIGGLIAVQTLGGEAGPTVDARAWGVTVALVAAVLRAPLIVIVLAAACTTALVRAVT